MGTCYTYLLYDDFDWDYPNETKSGVMRQIKEDIPVATVLASWPNYIVVDLDKSWPLGDRAQSLIKYCNLAYVYTDSDAYHLERVNFMKNEVVEANKPKNRNKDFIDEAYNQWLERYQQARAQ